MRVILALAVAAISLGGCAVFNPEYALANADPGHSTAVSCAGPDDCAAKLRRARAWVAENSGVSGAPTVSVQEVAFGPGGHVIDFRATCQKPLGCRAALADLRVRFEDAMHSEPQAPASKSAI